MKVFRLETNPEKYSSNAYLLLSEWNKLGDINTLIDTGADGYIINHIEKINKGVGKKSIEKVILTHNHFDHTGGISEIKNKYDAKVYSFSDAPMVDHLLKDDEEILIGDCWFQVIHTPGHSSDSISLYCKSEGMLFSGDLNLRIFQHDDFSYSREYIDSIRKLKSCKIKIVYPGHGEPITENVEAIIAETYLNINEKYQVEIKHEYS